MNTILRKLALAVGFLGASAFATAANIDFNSVAAAGGNGTMFGASYSPLVTDGFSFTTLNSHTGHGHVITSPSSCSGGCADNGTQYLGGDMANLVMSSAAGSAFSVFSFDAAKAFISLSRPDVIQVIGTLLGGGTVSTTFTLGNSGFSSYALSGFTNLTQLTFQGADANGSAGNLWIGIDNINTSVSAVPEAETYAMLLAGLGALGAVARRRKVQKV